jgi:hypothetical protein
MEDEMSPMYFKCSLPKCDNPAPNLNSLCPEHAEQARQDAEDRKYRRILDKLERDPMPHKGDRNRKKKGNILSR